MKSKRINKYYFIEFAILLFLVVSAYLLTESVIYSLCVFVVISVYLFLLLNKRINKHLILKLKNQDLRILIKGFISNISSFASYDECLDKSKEATSQAFKDEYEMLANMSFLEKIEYLKKYFNSDLYDLFALCVNEASKEDESLNNFDLVIVKLNEYEEEEKRNETLARNKGIEYSIMSVLFILIGLFIKLSFDTPTNVTYLIYITILLIVLLFGIEIYSEKCFLKEREASKENENEKESE